MTDIVERLRQDRPQFYETLLKEAADEIERLREAKRRALEMADLRSKENAELRAALEDCRRGTKART